MSPWGPYNDLARFRPQVDRSQFYCCQCKGIVEKIASTGQHHGQGDGEILVFVTCHDDYCQLMIPFETLRSRPDFEFKVFERQDEKPVKLLSERSG